MTDFSKSVADSAVSITENSKSKDGGYDNTFVVREEDIQGQEVRRTVQSKCQSERNHRQKDNGKASSHRFLKFDNQKRKMI